MEKQIMIWCDRICYWNIDGISCILRNIQINSKGECVSFKRKIKPNLKPELRWWEEHVVEKDEL